MDLYRHVFMRLFAEAVVDDSPRIAAALAEALGSLGTATINEHGRYWKDPALVEFTVGLEPAGPVDDCVTRLITSSGPTWHGDRADRDLVWTRAPGSGLLHPAVVWAWLLATSAPAAPRYHDRDIVRVADNDASRARGLAGCEGVIGGSAPGADGCWRYAVRLAGQDQLDSLDEVDLEPTGRSQPAAAGEHAAVISVSPTGVVTGMGLLRSALIRRPQGARLPRGRPWGRRGLSR